MSLRDPAGVLESTAGQAGGYKPNEIFKSYLGVSAKQTITNNHPKPYADDPETLAVETTKSEVGLSSLSELNLKVGQMADFTSSLDLFSNLVAADQVDVKWKNRLAVKLLNWVTFNIELDIFYDKDISTRRQLRQAMTAGISWDFL